MAPSSQAQHQIDTRALELAAKALGRVESLEQRADVQRQELRQEVHAGFDGLKTDLRELGSLVHGRISKLNDARYSLVIGVAGFLIVFLLALVGWLLVNGTPWGAVAARAAGAN